MRLDVIDVIKAISILMIVNVHLISGPFFFIGCTYHVIAFFFTAGIMHSITEKWQTVSILQFLSQKASRLMYPYVMLSLCYVCMHMVLNLFRGESLYNDVIESALIQSITLRGIGTLWFLPVLLFAELIFYILKKCKAPDWLIVVIGLSSVFLSSFLNKEGICGSKWYGDYSQYGLMINNPLTLCLGSINALLFIEFGYLFNKKFPRLLRNIQDIPYKSLFSIFVACILSFVVDFCLVSFYHGDLHKLDIGNPFVYIACSVTGIVFVVSLSFLICRTFKHISLLLNWGTNSLIIMTTHTEYYINSIALLLVSSVVGWLNISLDNKMISLVSLLIIMVIEMILIIVIKRTPLKYIYNIPKKGMK